MRGVNKLVLEVRPDNEYFEKALLFLNPDKCGSPQKEISDSAEKLLTDIKPGYHYRKSTFLKSLLLIIAGITAGSLLSWSAMFIFQLL